MTFRRLVAVAGIAIGAMYVLTLSSWQARLFGHFAALQSLDGIATSSVPVVTIKQNTTLVILMGSLRCGEDAWKTLYENVLDVNMADLAIITQEPRRAFENASLFARAKHTWMVSDYKDWGDALDLINGTAWRDTLLPLYNKASNENILLGGVQDIRGSGAIIFMIRWFLSQKIIELGLENRYDRFVVTRPDHYYMCQHNISKLDPQFLWVPQGEDWNGISDRHVVVSSKYVLQALDVLPPLLSNPIKYKQHLADERYNTERFLHVRWKEEGLLEKVRRFDRMMFICMIPGDTTRWEPMKRKVKEGVHIKYRKEYPLCLGTCKGN